MIRTLRLAGRPYRVELHAIFGPIWLNARDEHRRRQWGDRHPFWTRYERWAARAARSGR